jgi:CubicO group peptidase (beta-lactamase class C family)
VPSAVDSPPAPRYAAAVGRAREVVRAAVLEQNLPGVSVAIGAGGTVVWAEGFGWRDVVTRAPVTPGTRFNIGTAAPAVTAAVAPLGLTNTGAEAAAEWSPEHIGEPEEDFPPFTIIRHVILQPLGLAPAEYPLAGDRATFYVPRSDDNPRRGRRLMYMRDLACCAGTLASYSTASDLVRVGLANGGTINGELAGGMVMSLMTLSDRGIVVAVLSNIAHANTSALAVKIGDAIATQAR